VGLDAEGQPIAWRDHLATPTREGDQADGGDLHEIAVEGARAMPYAVPTVEVRWGDVAAPISTGIWRSVGHSYDAWALESMIDEAAHAAGEDAVRYRLSLLSSKPRHRAALERATAMARWGEAVPEGRARGVAVHECYGSVCAQVAEVSRSARGVRVHRVWAAIDCGRAVNPSGVEAQIEGGIVFGLTAALYGDVRIERGRIAVSNFHDYPLLRIDEMPEIEVAILEHDAPPSGVGELGVPPIAPAVTNALFALTGARIRRLPIVPAA
jgi:isoquinoline 1-oxidoreductase beta subunit